LLFADNLGTFNETEGDEVNTSHVDDEEYIDALNAECLEQQQRNEALLNNSM
jgi:hypothetical protein